MRQGGWTPERPTATWSGEGLTLDAEHLDRVRELARRARRTEPSITALVERALTGTAAELVKADGRLKTVDSIARKVAADLAGPQRPGASPRTGFERLDDLVRYTVVVNDDVFTATTLQIMSTMRDMSGEPTRVANTFQRPGYKAVHAYWRRPNGVEFEVQFHTPTTLERARQARTDYERGRLPGLTNRERRELRRRERAAFSDVDPPPGVSTIAARSRDARTAVGTRPAGPAHHLPARRQEEPCR